jgi:hypothetical protein
MSDTHHMAIIADIDGPIDWDDAATLESIAKILFRDEFGDRFKGLSVSLPDAEPDGGCLLEPSESTRTWNRHYARHQLGYADAAPENLI